MENLCICNSHCELKMWMKCHIMDDGMMVRLAGILQLNFSSRMTEGNQEEFVMMKTKSW